MTEAINPNRLPIFDSHAHYDDKAFSEDLIEAAFKMKQNGVIGVINCGVNYTSSMKCIELAEKEPMFYAAVGVHPEDLYGGQTLDREIMTQLISNEKVVAIGEIGLDYHWDSFSHEEQIRWFMDQIDFAKEHDLPVIVHDREAHNDTIQILKQTKPKGVVLCFSGSLEMAKEVLKLGMYIGIGGVVTFKNARKLVDVAEILPLERLLLETDAPYLAPEPFRGKRCTSDLIYFTADKIAEIKGVSTEKVVNASLENTKALFTKIK